LEAEVNTPSIEIKTCLREPIPEIFDAARLLDAAVSLHHQGRRALADELIRIADNPAITEWSESLWGAGGPWTRPLPVENPREFVARERRVEVRMPTSAEKRALLERDGYHCRFCGIPLVRSETRSLIRECYPEALRWGSRNADQHAALQAMWLQYDHLLPHARGGTNDRDNMVVACAPCNCGRSNLTLEEVGVADPRARDPLPFAWDGLERFRK
jgi:hypothetical protein